MKHLSSRNLTVLLIVFLSAAVVLVVILFTGGSVSGKPDPAACKAAMQKQFAYGMSHPDAPAGTRPSACKGVSDKDLQRFASEIVQDYLNGGGA